MPQTRPRAHKWLRRAALAVGSVLLALLAAELLLRAAGWLTGSTRTLTADPVLGWRMLPGLSKWGDGWSAQRPGTTNTSGWRDDEFDVGRTTDRRRILALGDSYVFGFGVDQGKRFTELLENERVEVLNFGICAWGTDQQLLLFESDGPPLQPDVVVWVICVHNDLDDIRSDRKAGWSKPWFRLDGDQLELQPVATEWWLSLRTKTHLGELVLRVLDRGRPAQTFAPSWQDADPLPLFAALARRLAASVQASGAQLLAVIEPPPTAVPEPADATVTAVRNALGASGIAYLDLLPRFHAEGGRWSELRLQCGHWSELGHQVVAEAIREELDRRAWW